MTDSDLPSSAGITPANPSMLSTFLNDHRDAPGFELTYTADGSERRELCHSVSLAAVALERLSAAPAIQCTPVEPQRDQFTVGVDAIDLLAVVEPPAKLYTARAETSAEEATGLRRLAEANPDAVQLSSLFTLLDREDENPFGNRSHYKHCVEWPRYVQRSVRQRSRSSDHYWLVRHLSGGLMR
ncbi:hypothetical protein ACFQMM_22460 [Saliphagus sp. GCM10025308]